MLLGVANPKLYHLMSPDEEPSHAITIARRHLRETSLTLQTQAQRSLLRSIGVQTLGIGSSSAIYAGLGWPLSTCGAVASLGLVSGFYTLERDWRRQRLLFEADVQERGRLAIEHCN